jgi:hypothetical protein
VQKKCEVHENIGVLARRYQINSKKVGVDGKLLIIFILKKLSPI